MPFWTFLKLPEFPAQYKSKDNRAKLVSYEIEKGKAIPQGEAIALFKVDVLPHAQTLALKIAINGTYLDRAFFEEPFFGALLEPGDPIGLVLADGELVHKISPYWEPYKE